MVAPPTLVRVTVAQAVESYIGGFPRAVVMEAMSKITAANYTRDLTEFATLAGPTRVLDDVTSDDLDEVMVAYGSKPDGRYNDPHGKTRSVGATARFKQSVSRMFTHAARVGWVQVNPVPDMQVTFKGHRTRAESRTALSQSSATALLGAAAPSPPSERRPRADQDTTARDRFILHVLIEVGPRVSELCSTDRADITTDDSGVAWLTIRHGKGGKPRRVSLSPATMRALTDYDLTRSTPQARTRRTPAGDLEVTVPVEDADRALLLTWRGVRMRPRDVEMMVHRMVARMPAEVRRDVTPHGLRHTAATLLLVSGAADVMTVRDILGHASVATTSTYLDGVDAQMVAAVRQHPVTMPHRGGTAALPPQGR